MYLSNVVYTRVKNFKMCIHRNKAACNNPAPLFTRHRNKMYVEINYAITEQNSKSYSNLSEPDSNPINQ